MSRRYPVTPAERLACHLLAQRERSLDTDVKPKYLFQVAYHGYEVAADTAHEAGWGRSPAQLKALANEVALEHGATDEAWQALAVKLEAVRWDDPRRSPGGA